MNPNQIKEIAFKPPVQVSENGELRVGWQSPSNIALVKYWGKKGHQLPMNPSLSMTLNHSVTRTMVHSRKKDYPTSVIDLKYFFEGKENQAFQAKVQAYLEKISLQMHFLRDYSFVIESTNTFPHSAGIASSASSMSALALCLVSLDCYISSHNLSISEFYRKASDISRLGSGSACRSVYGNFAVWGKFVTMSGSDNRFAIPSKGKIHNLFTNLHDSILIIDRAEKSVSSRAGHEKMNRHSYKEGRIRQAGQNLKKITRAMTIGDWETFSRIVENEALSLHGLMMSSDPGFILVRPHTLKVIEKIHAFSTETGVRITYTLDAGPNLHVLYPEADRERVRQFIDNELCSYCADQYVIHDKIGSGPSYLPDNHTEIMNQI